MYVTIIVEIHEGGPMEFIWTGVGAGISFYYFFLFGFFFEIRTTALLVAGIWAWTKVGVVYMVAFNAHQLLLFFTLLPPQSFRSNRASNRRHLGGLYKTTSSKPEFKKSTPVSMHAFR